MNQLPKLTFYVKEVAMMLGITSTEVRIIAKFLKIKKIFGMYLFTKVDIDRIEEFTKGGDENENT